MYSAVFGRMLSSLKCAQNMTCGTFVQCQLSEARIMLPRILSLHDSRLALATKEIHTRFVR